MNTSAVLPLLASNATDPLPTEYYAIATLSRITGTLSIVVWLFAQLPQVLENYLNESVAGVSAAFLGCWITGDVTNLIGCLLTRALPFQTCLAAYYCFIDFVLFIQFWYYTRVYPRQKVHHNMLQSPNMMRPVISRGSTHNTPHHMRLNRFEVSPLHALTAQRSASSGGRGRRGRRSFISKILTGSVLSASFGRANGMPVEVENSVKDDARTFVSWIMPALNNVSFALAHVHCNRAFIGTVSGWLSSCMYLSLRSPQIWKNFRSKSTKGISPYLFLFAMLGNTFYTTSIVSDLYLLSKYDQHLGDTDFHSVFQAQLPFVIGSFGTVLFDFTLLIQVWWYRDRSKESKFRKVSGELHARTKDENARKRVLGSSTMHFTKPDWYTNNYAVHEDDELYDTESRYFNGYGRRTLAQHENGHPDETSSLVRHSFLSSPPLHYVASTSSMPRSDERKGRKGISGTFSALAKSFTNSPMLRSPSMSSTHSISASPALGTSMIPSLVGTYSSVSKRMLDDSKVPFLPSDFLHPDFTHRSSGSDT